MFHQINVLARSAFTISSEVRVGF